MRYPCTSTTTSTTSDLDLTTTTNITDIEVLDLNSATNVTVTVDGEERPGRVFGVYAFAGYRETAVKYWIQTPQGAHVEKWQDDVEPGSKAAFDAAPHGTDPLHRDEVFDHNVRPVLPSFLAEKYQQKAQ